MLLDWRLWYKHSQLRAIIAQMMNLLICSTPTILPLTRITQTSATTLDNMFPNNIDERECSQNGILVTNISGDFPICHIGHKNQVIEYDESFIIFRNYSNVKKPFFSTRSFWNRLVWNIHDIWRPASLYLVLLTIYKSVWWTLSPKKKINFGITPENRG